MFDTRGSTFKHRQNRNGTHDSICCICFLTVASTDEELGLRYFENTHACDPIQLYEVAEHSRQVSEDLQHVTSVANSLMAIAHHA
jgi:hypothetical protein